MPLLRNLIIRYLAKAAPVIITRSNLIGLGTSLYVALRSIPFTSVISLLITSPSISPTGILNIPNNPVLTSVTSGWLGSVITNRSAPLMIMWVSSVIRVFSWLELIRRIIWFFLSLGFIWPLRVLISLLGVDWALPGIIPGKSLIIIKTWTKTFLLFIRDYLNELLVFVEPITKSPEFWFLSALFTYCGYLYKYQDAPFASTQIEWIWWLCRASRDYSYFLWCKCPQAVRTYIVWFAIELPNNYLRSKVISIVGYLRSWLGR